MSKYTPKQLILTKRIEGSVRTMVWTNHSTDLDEIESHNYAMREGWFLHAYRVGEPAIERAKQMHVEIEEGQRQSKLLRRIREHQGS